VSIVTVSDRTSLAEFFTSSIREFNTFHSTEAFMVCCPALDPGARCSARALSSFRTARQSD